MYTRWNSQPYGLCKINKMRSSNMATHQLSVVADMASCIVSSFDVDTRMPAKPTARCVHVYDIFMMESPLCE